MIETILSIDLFVDEKMEIKKHRLIPKTTDGNVKRISIVTGIYGDELEGQYVCYELIRRINERIESLSGIVDVYPALNPMGIDAISRGIPMFDLDMNRIFPGSEDGAVAEHVAAKIIADITGSHLCVDVHASNIYLREIPQVRISADNSRDLLPYAKLLNVDFVWVHTSETIHQSSLAYSLNEINIPTLAVEMGVGMRVTKDYGDQLVDGIFNLMHHMGIWDEIPTPVKEPTISTDGHVALIHAECSGMFLPMVNHTMCVEAGDHIGNVVNPLTGKVEEQVMAPVGGIVFSLRAYPIVYKGSLIARILGGGAQ